LLKCCRYEEGILGIIVIITPTTIDMTNPIGQQQLAEAFTPDLIPMYSDLVYAPVAASGDNVYVTWFENATGQNRPEVFFKASSDAGETFGDVINLSNSVNATSDDPAIPAEGENVYVTFWDDKTGPRKAFVVADNDNGPYNA
jgi:hypothetical protein